MCKVAKIQRKELFKYYTEKDKKNWTELSLLGREPTFKSRFLELQNIIILTILLSSLNLSESTNYEEINEFHEKVYIEQVLDKSFCTGFTNSASHTS